MDRVAPSSSPAAIDRTGQQWLIPQPQPPHPHMSQEESLHCLLSGRASLSGLVPSSCFALHARQSKLNLTSVPHPLAWSAASASSATLSTHAHYSASELLTPSSSHVHIMGGIHGEEWRPTARRGITPKFAHTPRIIPNPDARTHEEQLLSLSAARSPFAR